MLQLMSRYFFGGLITLLPLFITLYLITLLFSVTDHIFGGLLFLLTGRSIPGLSLVVTAVLILLVGYIADRVLGRALIHLFEALLFRIPIVKSIYSTAKKINDVFFQQKEGNSLYQRTCLVEYPRKGIYSVGFLTSEAIAEFEQKTNRKKMVHVFIPNTPTPATGFLIIVPQEEVIMLDLKFDEAFRLLVSAGALKPS